MKSFKAIALAGALAIGEITIAEFSQPTKTAAAVSDAWGINTVYDLENVPISLDYSLGLSSSFKLGDTFRIADSGFVGVLTNECKIFKIESDGSLSRYKTITPKVTANTHVWETTFTSGYTKGNYVAIVKIGNDFSSTKTFTYNG
ncbi:hypothetical protein CN586_23535 [Bacillus toyonensis]|uniref:DUF5065 family protein n=1 Tax=Bacillus toyonensis TaxID=155322 RepID=UPI000BF023B5|nr:DUF5065 family protein [Bacillus toyonensis]PEK41546.1 hypothetical protein CN586_23535 [Bacillus toyonensis]